MLRLNFEPASSRRELARDEAMLQWADSVIENQHEDQRDEPTTESFRVWRFTEPTVILGRSSRIDEEVDRAWCAARGIDVLRRCTGGASVVGGPGCLMYSVVVRVPGEGGLRKIDAAHDFVMQRLLAAVQVQVPTAERAGTCDLIFQNRKFSGNSLRIARHHLLYHGTLLVDADLDLIDECLALAPRQPEYRQGRNHRDFVGNVHLDELKLTESLESEFGKHADAVSDARSMSQAGYESIMEEIAEELMRSRYGDASWHERR